MHAAELASTREASSHRPLSVTGARGRWPQGHQLVTSRIAFAIAVIGEYVGKIYFETKSRPRYIVDQEIDPSLESGTSRDRADAVQLSKGYSRTPL